MELNKVNNVRSDLFTITPSLFVNFAKKKSAEWSLGRVNREGRGSRREEEEEEDGGTVTAIRKVPKRTYLFFSDSRWVGGGGRVVVVVAAEGSLFVFFHRPFFIFPPKQTTRICRAYFGVARDDLENSCFVFDRNSF